MQQFRTHPIKRDKLYSPNGNRIKLFDQWFRDSRTQAKHLVITKHISETRECEHRHYFALSFVGDKNSVYGYMYVSHFRRSRHQMGAEDGASKRRPLNQPTIAFFLESADYSIEC